MSVRIRQIPLEKLVAHPDSSNRMSRTNFAKLIRNIEQSGRYEPLVVRPCPGRRGFFQIINGHHRCEALRRLGRNVAEVVVWNVSDEQTDILLATLNRLSGRDSLEQKLALLRRLNKRTPIRKLARLLPQTRGQLERLTSTRPLSPALRRPAGEFAVPVVFFVSPAQQQIIEEAVSQSAAASDAPTRAGKRAAALTDMARQFLDQRNGRDGEHPAPQTRNVAATCT
jgi:hypothetical protein